MHWFKCLCFKELSWSSLVLKIWHCFCKFRSRILLMWIDRQVRSWIIPGQFSFNLWKIWRWNIGLTNFFWFEAVIKLNFDFFIKTKNFSKENKHLSIEIYNILIKCIYFIFKDLYSIINFFNLLSVHHFVYLTFIWT